MSEFRSGDRYEVLPGARYRWAETPYLEGQTVAIRNCDNGTTVDSDGDVRVITSSGEWEWVRPEFLRKVDEAEQTRDIIPARYKALDIALNEFGINGNNAVQAARFLLGVEW